MKREIFIRGLILILVLVGVSVLKRWFTLSAWPFWLGGVIGSAILDFDSLIYIFFLAPQELSSQRVVYLIRNRNFLGAVRFIFETRAERTDLVFHSNLFLIVALILVFLDVYFVGQSGRDGSGFGDGGSSAS